MRQMKIRQQQERRQIEQYDRQSQGKREELATLFDHEKQVLLHAQCNTEQSLRVILSTVIFDCVDYL